MADDLTTLDADEPCDRCGHRLAVHTEHAHTGEGCQTCACPAFEETF